MSTTARAVAFGRAVGLPGAHDELAAHALGRLTGRLADRTHRLAARSPSANRMVRLATGGLVSHATLRMLAIDEAVTDGVAAGVEQIVIVGAGLDTRGWRLPALAGLPVLEIDLPATQRYKQQHLRDVEPLARVRLVEADLEHEDLEHVLARSDHRDDKPTLWLWEAVAMYLPSDAVRATVGSLSSRSAAGSLLVMTVVHPNLLDARPTWLRRPLGRLARAGFAGLYEPLRTALDDREVTDLLGTYGFEVVDVTGVADWARRAGQEDGPDLFAAERLVVARRPA